MLLLSLIANPLIDDALQQVPPRGLNIALLDPFGLEGLDRDVIAKLARFERMDLLIHFPTTGIKRNFWQGAKEKLDELIGRPAESDRVSDVAQRIEELRAELATLGYTGAAVRSIPVKHAGRLLYHVMFASKNPRGDAIWESISKTLSSGQRRLF
jgi:three-Cys-motif partner protein